MGYFSNATAGLPIRKHNLKMPEGNYEKQSAIIGLYKVTVPRNTRARSRLLAARKVQQLICGVLVGL